ncbi:MAG TPA: hypothetical protein VEP90_20075, partial [Methylomirabilota bacterium]|nr:hypothetical protein [Methylomirabilota bacterium]
MTGNENKIRLYDYFDANEKMAEADPEEKRDTCVDFAVMFALERGILKEDAEKLRAALVGTYTQSKGVDVSPQSILTPGSLSLVTWKIHIC